MIIINVEHDVGKFSLDILAKDANDGRIIAIENQLEITDHCHLGQILTYASGVDAKVIVWVCKQVREEHRKAVDWLNQITNDETEFFAVEIQLIKVDQSAPAPYFKVKASPNNWSKEQKKKAAGTGAVSQREEGYQKFFTQLLEEVHQKLPGYTNSRKTGYDSWKSFPSGISGATYALGYKTNGRFACEFYIDTGDKEQNKEMFDRLMESNQEIEYSLGTLSWERLDSRRACRIAQYINFTNNEDIIQWGIDRLQKFKECFSRYL